MNLSANNLLLGAFVSLVGMALLLYGRKAARGPHIVVGLLLIVYPYFVGNLVFEVVIALVLVVGLALVSYLGF
jgi:hypothetical protein